MQLVSWNEVGGMSVSGITGLLSLRNSRALLPVSRTLFQSAKSTHSQIMEVSHLYP